MAKAYRLWVRVSVSGTSFLVKIVTQVRLMKDGFLTHPMEEENGVQ